MIDLNTLMTEDRRLAALKLMAQSGQYQVGAPLLHLALAGMGHGVSLDTIHADLAWLRDAGLAVVRQTGDIPIATLTTRGLDVARGLTQVPGVARPRP